MAADVGSMNDAAGKRNDAEDAKEKLYTYASYVPFANFKGSVTEVSLKIITSLASLIVFIRSLTLKLKFINGDVTVDCTKLFCMYCIIV